MWFPPHLHDNRLYRATFLAAPCHWLIKLAGCLSLRHTTFLWCAWIDWLDVVQWEVRDLIPSSNRKPGVTTIREELQSVFYKYGRNEETVDMCALVQRGCSLGCKHADSWKGWAGQQVCAKCIQGHELYHELNSKSCIHSQGAIEESSELTLIMCLLDMKWCVNTIGMTRPLKETCEKKR